MIERWEWKGVGHPAWPDPLLFNNYDAALRWYEEQHEQNPQIRILLAYSQITDVTPF